MWIFFIHGVTTAAVSFSENGKGPVVHRGTAVVGLQQLWFGPVELPGTVVLKVGNVWLEGPSVFRTVLFQFQTIIQKKLQFDE